MLTGVFIVELLLGLVIVLVIAFLVHVNRNVSKFRGLYGEKEVKKILSTLSKSDYRVYHDLYIPKEDGSTSQIDHLVVSPYGVFVIETKHYSGQIYGNEYKRDWTHLVRQRNYNFYNPIWQNNGHIKSLSEYTGLDRSLFVSVIAFSSSSTFKFKEPFKTAYVIQFPHLKKVILSETSRVLSEAQLRRLNTYLSKIVVTDPITKSKLNKQHVDKIKQNVKVIKSDKNNDICPSCNSKLEKVYGKHGVFIGCTNFPKCRYTEKIKQTINGGSK